MKSYRLDRQTLEHATCATKTKQKQKKTTGARAPQFDAELYIYNKIKMKL